MKIIAFTEVILSYESNRPLPHKHPHPIPYLRIIILDKVAAYVKMTLYKYKCTS